MSKIIDESFQNIGTQPGLVIWRIENFNLNKLRPKEYGSFHTGDSYLILSTKGEKNKPCSWDIHFWLGSKSTVDEYATAAIKAVELDDYLGGRPVQYREVQNFESSLFLSYFDSGIFYLDGGIQSALTITSDIKKTSRLFMVKGKKNIRIVQVPLLFSSLNKSDVFILDDNERIYQWNPPGANAMERLRASVFAKKIRDDEHGGRAVLKTLDEDWQTNVTFWDIFKSHDASGNFDQIKQESEIKDNEFEKHFTSSEIKLYRVTDANSSDATVKLEASGKLTRNMLDSNDCFIVDSHNGLFSWIGKKCTKKEKETAVQGVRNLIKFNNYPNHIPIVTVIEDGETTAFKSFFDWN